MIIEVSFSDFLTPNEGSRFQSTKCPNSDTFVELNKLFCREEQVSLQNCFLNLTLVVFSPINKKCCSGFHGSQIVGNDLRKFSVNWHKLRDFFVFIQIWSTF